MSWRGVAAACLAVVLGATATPAAHAEGREIRIGLQFGLAYLPIMIAETEGFIARRAAEAGIPDLKVDLRRFSGSTAMNEALLSNSIDAGVLGTAGALIAWEKTRGRRQIKSLAGISASKYTLFTNKPKIASLADFTPEDKIAVTAFNSPQAILLRVASARDLGGSAKVEPLLVYLPHPDALAGLLAGQGISGYFASSPFAQVLEKDRHIKAILTSRDLVPGPDATSTTLAASQAYVEDNPKLAAAIFAGIEDADRLIASDPKRAAEIYLMHEKMRIGVDELVGILTDGSTSFTPAPHGIVAWAKFMQAQGLIKTVPGNWKDIFFPLAHGLEGS